MVIVLAFATNIAFETVLLKAQWFGEQMYDKDGLIFKRVWFLLFSFVDEGPKQFLKIVKISYAVQYKTRHVYTLSKNGFNLPNRSTSSQFQFSWFPKSKLFIILQRKISYGSRY